MDALRARLRPELFKALSDPMRVAIVALLATRAEPASVSEIAAGCAIDISGVSRHLKLLRDAEVVHAEKRGREVLYGLAVDRLADTLRGLADALEACRGAARI